MAFTLTRGTERFPKIISQRQIDLEENWWKERVKLMDLYMWKPSLHWDKFKTTLDGYWWHHHQVALGPLVIEFTIRGKQIWPN